MPKILITGGTGLIGSQLTETLLKLGYDVCVLSRQQSNHVNITSYVYDEKNGTIDDEAFKNLDYIIHLAGANISEKRWTTSRKQLILESRIKLIELLYNKIKTQNIALKAFISASAVGYYGAITSDHIFTEQDKSHPDFIGKTCKLWEASALKFNKLNIRTVILRTGIVLTKKGGALAKIKSPITMGFGAALGSGKQYMPWIHIDDLCQIYIKAVTNQLMQGVYNAVAPEYVTNKDFTRILAKILKKPLWVPNVPNFILKLAFGDMSNIILKGSRVSSEKLRDTEFNFQYSNLENALKDLLKT